MINYLVPSVPVITDSSPCGCSVADAELRPLTKTVCIKSRHKNPHNALRYSTKRILYFLTKVLPKVIQFSCEQNTSGVHSNLTHGGEVPHGQSCISLGYLYFNGN